MTTLLLLALASLSALQSSANASATISGHTVDTNGKPLAEITVIASNARDEFSTVTDQSGAFTFHDIPPGIYQLYPRSNELGISSFAAMRTITLQRGANLSDLTLELPAPSSLSGSVTGEHGDPLPDVSVSAFVRTSIMGRDELLYRGDSVTDARGAFRIWGLPKGSYYLYAKTETLVPRTIQEKSTPRITPLVPKYASAFYPSALYLGGATAVPLAAGQDQVGIDISLPKLPAICVRATPILTTPISQNREISVDLLSTEQQFASLKLEYGQGRVSPGPFEFCGLPPLPTSYSLVISERSGQETKALAQMTFAAGKRHLDLGQVPLSLPQTIQGRVEYSPPLEARTAAESAPKRISLRLEPRGHQNSRYESVVSGVDPATGVFQITNVMTDSYNVRISCPPGTYIKGVFMAGTDVLAEPLTPRPAELRVVLGTDGADLSGTIVDKNGNPIPGANVLAIPQMRSLLAADGGYKLQPADQNGVFRFPSKFPPGEYTLIALPDAGPDLFLSDSTLNDFSRNGTSISLAPRSSKTISLTSQ